MAEWGAVLRNGCSRLQSREFDPSSREDALAVLGGEGVKRLQSFIFELLFQRGIKRYCSGMPVAYGWYVIETDKTDTPLWIKLETEPLTVCDDLVIALLKSRGCSVLKVRYSDDLRGFTGAWLFPDGWLQDEDLADLLLDTYDSPKRVTGPESATPEETRLALDDLFSRQTDEERRVLVLSRMLINCYIVPFIRTQPMDIDAVVMDETGNLRFLEFKRKYPAKSMTFGIDELPHAALAKWLNSVGCGLSNIVLCDPLWNKEIAPRHLLDKNITRPYAYWLGVHLRPDHLAKEAKLHTKGVDSGMYGQGRSQIDIPIEEYMILGRAFAPSGLPAFLNGQQLAHVTRSQLWIARDEARAKYDEGELRTALDSHRQ